MASRLLPVALAVLHLTALSAEAVCPNVACVPLSRDGLNEPFSSLEAAELSARCLTACGAEVTCTIIHSLCQMRLLVYYIVASLQVEGIAEVFMKEYTYTVKILLYIA